MQVAPSASTYAPAPGDLTSQPAPGGAFNSYTDQPQDNVGAFADSGPGGNAQPDPYSPYADPTLASTSLFAPTDHTPSTTLALMVQAQTKPLLVTAENAADLGIDFAHTKPLTVTPENAAGLGIDLVSTKPLLLTPENAAGLNLPPQTGSAAPASATAPNASPTEIAALELLLAEPANQDIIAQYGPPLRPLNTDTNVGQGILARFGPDLGARLTQLQEAQDGVRNEYLHALDQATQSPGPDTPGSQWVPGTGQGETAEPGYWKLDPAAFSRHYAQGDSLAQRVFADMHGQDPLVFHEGREGDAHSEPSYHTLGPFRLAKGQPYGSDPSLPDACLLRDYTQLSPEHSADLINKEYLWFDPVNGWSTSADNIQAPTGFLDKVLPVAFSALMCMVALPPVGTLLSQAGAGTFVQGAAMGAMGSAISQTVMTGGIDFGNLLRSALTGGIAGSVMQYTGLKDMLGSADLAKSSLAHLGKAGLTGLLQEATGGKFKDGFMNSALASIAQGVGDHLNQQIGELKDISPEQASVLKLLSKAASSALKIAGTNDPAAGFAGEFLSGVLGDGLQGAQGKGQEQGQVGNEGQPGQAAQPGDRPSSDWVRNLGASEVDAQTAQWVEAFANPAILPPSQGIQVASAPIGTVGDAGYFDDSGAYIEPAQLIWADGTTSTLAQGNQGEPMLPETEVRETAQPMLPEDFRRQEIEYRNSTEVQPPQYSFTELVEMSHSPVDSYSAQEYRDAAAQYRASVGEDFRRDSIYNGLWTRAAALDAAAGGGWGQEVMNDITGFATEEGLHAQTGVAIGGALGRGIGNRLGGSVDNVVEAAGTKPDGAVPAAGSGVGGVSTNGANGGTATAGGTANAATYAGLKLDLKTTQAANEVVESLQTTGKLPPNYVDKAQAAQQGWQPGKALNNFVPGGQLGGDVFNNVPPVNGLPQAANRTWQEVDIGMSNTMSRSNQLGTRLLYSNDGLLYITTNHYKTVTPIGSWKK
ncbi:ribonuclease domain-containing protein [Acidovorax sp. SD340]|uniref:Ribonuclease domain-containing protein n=3 Tax=Acidovorax facilis TaxID=12917 RepID=A0ABV8DFF7_9BURK|nr:ribonuclease domain-containing protein [Acidovorax sp. SD340]